MNQIFISQSLNPYFNVALEKKIMRNHQQGVALLLWQNKPSVFIGRNQNIYAECRIDYLKKYDVLPVRRYSGGGTVYQDEGNLNFSFICSENQFDEEKYKIMINHALWSLGIESEFNGRNDLLFRGKKISGQAYFQEDHMILYHGTLLFNVNIDMLEKVLSPSQFKLKSKGIASVKSRVMNLIDYFPKLTVENIKQSFIKSFCEIYQTCEDVEYINETMLIETQKLESKEWIYGQCPKWNVILERKLSIGNIEIFMNIQDGYIENIHIYTDSLFHIDFQICIQKLVGSWFDENNIIEIIQENMLILS